MENENNTPLDGSIEKSIEENTQKAIDEAKFANDYKVMDEIGMYGERQMLETYTNEELLKLAGLTAARMEFRDPNISDQDDIQTLTIIKDILKERKSA